MTQVTSSLEIALWKLLDCWKTLGPYDRFEQAPSTADALGQLDRRIVQLIGGGNDPHLPTTLNPQQEIREAQRLCSSRPEDVHKERTSPKP